MKKFYLLFVQFLISGLLNAQAPTITGFSPKKGDPATLVTLTGTNFNTTPQLNTVYFGATAGIVLSSTATTIKVFVPVGATYKPVTVFNATTLLSGSSKSYFTPTFSPGKGSVKSADFLGKIDFATKAKPTALALYDFFQHGKVDMVYTLDTTSLLSLVLTCESSYNFSITGSIDNTSFLMDFNHGSTLASRPQAVAFGDIDMDGKLDFALASYGSNGIGLEGNRDEKSYGSGLGPIDVAICDLDLDGRPDVISANAIGLGISILRNTNTVSEFLSFNSSVNLVTGFQPVALATGDIDRDGKEDIVLANANTDSSLGLSILRNNSVVPGSISFDPVVTFTTGPDPKGLALADIDGDNKLDIIVVNQKGNTISILRNTAKPGKITSSSLAPKVDFATGNKPKSIAIGDLNGDGKPDIVVTNTKSNSISLFQNKAVSGSITAASLAKSFTLKTGSLPVSVAIADVDGDGKPDIGVANHNSNTISIIKNEPLVFGLTDADFNLIEQSMHERYLGVLKQNRSALNTLNANVYPNPADDIATLSFNNTNRSAAIKLTDINGKIVWIKENVQTDIVQIPVNNLVPGTYFVSIVTYLNGVSLKLIKR